VTAVYRAATSPSLIGKGAQFRGVQRVCQRMLRCNMPSGRRSDAHGTPRRQRRTCNVTGFVEKIYRRRAAYTLAAAKLILVRLARLGFVKR